MRVTVVVPEVPVAVTVTAYVPGGVGVETGGFGVVGGAVFPPAQPPEAANIPIEITAARTPAKRLLLGSTSIRIPPKAIPEPASYQTLDKVPCVPEAFGL